MLFLEKAATLLAAWPEWDLKLGALVLPVVRVSVLLVGYIAAMCGTALPAAALVLFIWSKNPDRWPPPPTVGPGDDFLLKAGIDRIWDT